MKKIPKLHSISHYVAATMLVFAVSSAVLSILIVAATALSSYTAVRRTLESQIKGGLEEHYFSQRFDRYGETFDEAAQQFVNHFEITGVEVWVLDRERNIAASSAGTAGDTTTDMPDYDRALESPDRHGFWNGNFRGDPVYALSYILDLPGYENAAVRLLHPLTDVNENLLKIGLLTALIWLLFNSLLLLFGRMILRWVREPIAQVSAVTAKIAEGDYDQRIPLPPVRNEIYQLSEDINNMAEQVALAEKMKMDFVSTISHELRTPLTAIKGWGETLLQKKDLDGDLTRRGLSIIIEESARLDHLVEELLDFSRMQNNSMALRSENIDVLAELDDVVFLFHERAARKGVELISKSPEEPAPMAGDPARIRQVFINLLDNAFKHTPQGGSVTVSAQCGPEEELRVTIQDTGCGVDEKDLPHLTEKFYKASTSTKGSGIGLAVVSEILKAHDCALELESAVGKGFTVHITFPLQKK